MAMFIPLASKQKTDIMPDEQQDSLPSITIEESEEKIVLKCTFPGFMMSDVAQEIDGQMIPFKEIGISGAGFLSEPGRPLMPSFGRFVQIPPGCAYTIDVDYKNPVEIKDVVVIPAQESAKDGPENDGFEFNREAYEHEKPYPREMVQVGEPQNIDGYKTLLIHIRPLQYNPSKKMLKGYGMIRVAIEMHPEKEMDEEEQNELMASDPSANREAFGNLMLNPGRSILRRIGARPVPMPNISMFRPTGPEFLIIYENNLKKPAAELLHWKQCKGIKTEMISIKEIGNTSAKIKEHIRGRRKQFMSRLRYVLLFGDTDKIVTDEIGGNTTDHYFFTKKDPSQPHECMLPWISGGRIPVTNEKKGLEVVKQIIRYEKNPPCDPDYYRRMTFAAYFQDNAPQNQRADRAYMKTMESIRTHMITQGIDVDRVYVSNNPNPAYYKDGTPIPQAVKNAIVSGDNATDMLLSDTFEGQMIMAHRDHGGESGWSHPPLTTANIQSITSHHPSIFFSINCLTGRFDANPRDCFAESMLTLDGGAPSLIAATEVSGTWRNDSMIKAMFDAMWPGVIPTFPGTTASYGVKHQRLGDILNYAKSYLMIAHGINSGVRDHLEIYHVIGDPTLQLWSEKPHNLNLRAQIHRGHLKITTNTCPQGAVMTLWHKGKMIKRMEPKTTRITIPIREMLQLSHLRPIPHERRKALQICLSAPGHRFTEAKLNC